jgi:hypothetical protein
VKLEFSLKLKKFWSKLADFLSFPLSVSEPPPSNRDESVKTSELLDSDALFYTTGFYKGALDCYDFKGFCFLLFSILS